jgi:hypothetical protein
VAGATVEMALGDTWRRYNMGTVAATQLWERHRAWHRASSMNEWGSSDGGAPVIVTGCSSDGDDDTAGEFGSLTTLLVKSSFLGLQ